MGILSGETLNSLITSCIQCENYRAAVFFEDINRRNEFVREMKEADIVGKSVNQRRCTIRFKNGSYIEAIKTSDDAAKGRRYHALLFDGKISDDAMTYIYDPMLVPYINRGEFSDESNDALDEFLGEFVLKKEE